MKFWRSTVRREGQSQGGSAGNCPSGFAGAADSDAIADARHNYLWQGEEEVDRMPSLATHSTHSPIHTIPPIVRLYMVRLVRHVARLLCVRWGCVADHAGLFRLVAYKCRKFGVLWVQCASEYNSKNDERTQPGGAHAHDTHTCTYIHVLSVSRVTYHAPPARPAPSSRRAHVCSLFPVGLSMG